MLTVISLFKKANYYGKSNKHNNLNLNDLMSFNF